MEKKWSYTRNLVRIIVLSSITISLAVIITGILSYNNTKKSLIHKAKSQDIVFTVKSMASKVDGRIQRAVETSAIFARDPLNIAWLREEEKDQRLGKAVIDKLEDVANTYDYSNLFIVSTKTGHYYYRENGKKKKDQSFVVLSEDNPADDWFYKTLAAKQEISFNVNYDRAMDDSFLFINVLMGNRENPDGICGVGLSLKDISEEFRNFKVGKNSSLWMIDEKGIIQLADNREDIGKNYREFLPQVVTEKIQNVKFQKENRAKIKQDIIVSEYADNDGEIMDYAYCSLSSSDWMMVYIIPRKESISLIDSIRDHMLMTVIVVLLCFTILFYILSQKVADPYKQAMLMNKELEEEVSIRTLELQESNQKVLDSIEYAKRLQESILPLKETMEKVFKDHFVIWRPRDLVGGDFYWLKEIDDVVIFAIGDCTGHGVPGALMTMTVNAILHHVVTAENRDDPCIILKELHKCLKETLNKTSDIHAMDDGLDIALFCIKNNVILRYIGANIDLYIKNSRGIRAIKAQTRGVGYSYIKIKESLQYEELIIEEGDIFIVGTDGILHQNGGSKNYPFGKRRFSNVLQECRGMDLNRMKEELETILEAYMGSEQQRDDIAVTAFKIK